MKSELLEMRNIHKYFGSVKALKGVNVKVSSKEIVGLVGDNGAGKSTLIKILTGVLPQTKGEIYWKGEKVKISSVEDSRKLGIETVYQDQAVIGTKSVTENVFLGREVTRSFGPINILDKNKMREKSREAIERLGLNLPSVDQEVRFCSGGERQGVAIARALIFDAELVILDEPTTALSARGSEKVLDFVRQIKKAGTSCIFITHNLDRVHSVADRFIVLDRGEKIADVGRDKTSVDELKEMQLKGSEYKSE